MTEQEASVIACEELELENAALISEAVAASNTVTVYWRYCTGVDADTEQAIASVPFTNGFHEVKEEETGGVVYIQNNEASFGSDEEDAFDRFLDADKQVIEDKSVYFY